MSAVASSAAAPTAAVDTAHARFRSGRYFGSLDGLRAISVLAVMWHHTVGHDKTLPHFFSNGDEGVTLFFAISGFLITTLLLRERDTAGSINLRAFYIRRALRIFPLYYAVVAVYVVLTLLFERTSPAGREFFANLIFFLTYTSNWYVALEGRVIFYFAWSLAAEEQFYLLWPSVQRFFTPLRAVALMLTVIVVVAGLQWLGPPGGQRPAPLWYRAVTGIPLAICFGVVLAHLLHWRSSFVALRWLFASRLGSLFFLGVLIASLSWRGGPLQLIHLAAALMIGACVYREDHWLAGLLKWRVLAHLGAVSYGMYLMHMLVKNVVGRALSLLHVTPSPYLIFVLTVIGTVVVATLSFRHFESIFLRKKSQFSAQT